MTQHYDVAVVGGQSSGLIAAALLAKRGRRVILIDHNETALTYKHSGYELPAIAALTPAPESSPPIRRVHDELNITAEVRAHLRPLEPMFQAIMPRHRIDLRAPHEKMLEELALEFPELVTATENFFEKLFKLDDQLTTFLEQAPPLPPRGLIERFKTRRALRGVVHLAAPFEEHDLLHGIPPEHPVRDMLLSPLAFFGHLWDANPSTFHAVRLLSRYFRGTVDAPDSFGGLRETLWQAAKRAGVDVRRESRVAHITTARQRVSTLSLVQDRHVYSADYFIANTVAPFNEMLPNNRRSAKLAAEDHLTAPEGCLWVVNLVIDPQAIPCGMGRALFVLNGRRHPRGEETRDPPLLLRRYDAQACDPSVKRKAASVLSAACPLTCAELSEPAKQEALKNQIVARVKRVVPFLDDYLISVSTPEDGDAGAGNARPNPRLLHPIYGPQITPVLGIAARPSKTQFKNLAHCGRDVLPGLGIEGEYICGINTARTLEKWAGKKWA